MSLWESPWFFGRVHFIPLTSHTFFSLQCSYFLTLVTFIEEGHICRPPFWGSFFFFFFYRLSLARWRALNKPHVVFELAALESNDTFLGPIRIRHPERGRSKGSVFCYEV